MEAPGTFKTLAHQFRWPFAVAVIWTSGALWADGTWSIKSIIANFSTSFFLASWAWGQFFRVKNQSRVERNLTSIESRIEGLLAELNTSTRELIAYTTGVGSYCYVEVCPIEPTLANIFVRNLGKHPIYDLSVRIVNLEILTSKERSAYEGLHYDHTFRRNVLTPGSIAFLGHWRIQEAANYAFNIFFYARNGSYTQLLRLKRQDQGAWTIAARVLDADDVIVYEQIDSPDFARDITDYDWVRRNSSPPNRAIETDARQPSG